MKLLVLIFALISAATANAQLTNDELSFRDPKPQHYKLRARASKIDSRVRAYPKIGFILQDSNGKPADLQNASVDTRVDPRGKLVIWLIDPRNTSFCMRGREIARGNTM